MSHRWQLDGFSRDLRRSGPRLHRWQTGSRYEPEGCNRPHHDIQRRLVGALPAGRRRASLGKALTPIAPNADVPDPPRWPADISVGGHHGQQVIHVSHGKRRILVADRVGQQDAAILDQRTATIGHVRHIAPALFRAGKQQRRCRAGDGSSASSRPPPRQYPRTMPRPCLKTSQSSSISIGIGPSNYAREKRLRAWLKGRCRAAPDPRRGSIKLVFATAR